MTATSELLLIDAYKGLLRVLTKTWLEQSIADRAFAAWLISDLPLPESLIALVKTACTQLKVEPNYQYMAALGFAAEQAALCDEARALFASTLEWLVGRAPFVEGMPMSFCTDASALLGIVLGVDSLVDQRGRAAVIEWMSGFLLKSYHMPGLKDWQRYLLAATAHRTGLLLDTALPTTSDVADVRVALAAKGLLPRLENALLQDDEKQALLLLKEEPLDRLEIIRVALRIAAYSWIRRSAPVLVPKRATVADVGALLRAIPGALRRWTWEDKPLTRRQGAQPRKWHIDHEYHVQNMLFYVLYPIFPDLDDEKYLESVGHKQPRADLYISSLKLIIEVKFIYPTTSFQDIMEGVAADSGLYRSKLPNDTDIIAFIWDNTRRSEDHMLLEQGLKKLPGIIDAVVISRPGRMTEIPEDRPPKSINSTKSSI